MSELLRHVAVLRSSGVKNIYRLSYKAAKAMGVPDCKVWDDAWSSERIVVGIAKHLQKYSDTVDGTQVVTLYQKMTALLEIIRKCQSGDGTVTGIELKEKTDDLRESSFSLFNKIDQGYREEEDEPVDEAQSEGETQPVGKASHIEGEAEDVDQRPH